LDVVRATFVFEVLGDISLSTSITAVVGGHSGVTVRPDLIFYILDRTDHSSSLAVFAPATLYSLSSSRIYAQGPVDEFMESKKCLASPLLAMVTRSKR
jgi:hypothetical protein